MLEFCLVGRTGRTLSGGRRKRTARSGPTVSDQWKRTHPIFRSLVAQAGDINRQNVAWNYSVIRGVGCYRYSVVFEVGFRVHMAASLLRRRQQMSGVSARCDVGDCRRQRVYYDLAGQPVQVSVGAGLHVATDNANLSTIETWDNKYL